MRLNDIDGNGYLDFALGLRTPDSGPQPAEILAAIRAEMDKGLRTAAIHRGESELADLMAACVPSAEQTALVSTGSEAVQLALRIARAHDRSDEGAEVPRQLSRLARQSAGPPTRPANDGPATIGQDPDASRSVVIADWAIPMRSRPCWIPPLPPSSFEPAAVNAGCFEPRPAIPEVARDITRRHGVMLIFDEVNHRFRHALGGAQQMLRRVPDLSILGKALGAGLPIGAISGTQAAMACLQAGG